MYVFTHFNLIKVKKNTWTLWDLSDRCFSSPVSFCYFPLSETTDGNQKSIFATGCAGGLWGGEGGCQECVLVVYLCRTDEHRLTLWCLLSLNELSQRHGSVTGLLQKARLCATTTEQGPSLCLGAGTAEPVCLDSECHRVLYSQLECPLSSLIWVVLSVSTVMISFSNLTGEKFADVSLFLNYLNGPPFRTLKQDVVSWAAQKSWM